jgi:putative spermidine/putrescine transport system permease protein
VFATLLGTGAALALVRGRFVGRRVVAAIAFSPLVIPVVIIALGMFAVYARLRLIGTVTGLVAAHTALGVPFVVVSVGTSLRTIDANLDLAARGLGASRWQGFRRITLPLALPGVLAGALFAFVTSWDEVVAALFLTSAQFHTLPVQVWNQITEVVDPTVAAVSTLLVAVSTTVIGLAFVIRRAGAPAA